MLLSQYVVVASMLVMTSHATSPTSTSTYNIPTISPREPKTTISPLPTSTSSIYFMTTKYVTVPGETNSQTTIPAKTETYTVATCMQTHTPDKNGYVPPGTCNSLYDYYPSFSAALSFSILFGALTIAHIFLGIYYGKGYSYFIVMTALWETLGFSLRTISTKNQQSQLIRQLSSLFILTAPLWLTAFTLLLFSKLVAFYIPLRSRVAIGSQRFAARSLMATLVLAMIQVVGLNEQRKTALPDVQNSATSIYVATIALQELLILVFGGVLVMFHREVTKLERAGELGADQKGWRWLVWMIYGILIMLSTRIFFNLFEWSSGINHLSNELVFYDLEAIPMALAVGIVSVWHPGRMLARSWSGNTQSTGTSARRRGWDEEDANVEEHEGLFQRN